MQGGVQTFPEFFREALRSAEPHLGGAGTILFRQHAVGAQDFPLAGTVNVQADAGQGGTK